MNDSHPDVPVDAKESSTDFRTNEASGANSPRRRTLAIPAHIGERIDRRIEATRFSSDEEYVAFVLDEVLAKIERHDREGSHDAPESATADEQESAVDDGTDSAVESDVVQQRLESLGYL